MENLERISLNQITTERWTLPQAVEGCQRAGIQHIGLWRHKVQEHGLVRSVKLIRSSGVGVSSLCRGGAFPWSDEPDRRTRLDDNLRAIEEAATLGTDLLVLVCGGLAGNDISEARSQVVRGIEEVLPHAEACGVRLGVEPLHPAFASDRSVVTTLAEANDIAERIDSPYLGVVIDVYHVWWDPLLSVEIERAAGRIFGYHVNDWPHSNPSPLMGRELMGDGVIEIGGITSAVARAGYTGPVEVEVFNQVVWDTPGDEVLARIKSWFAAHKELRAASKVPAG